MVKTAVAVLFLIFIEAIAINAVPPTSAAPSPSFVTVDSFQDVLAPGTSKNYTLSLGASYDNLLLYLKGGGNNSNDTFDITLPASANSPWLSIQGELWFLTGPVDQGQYNVTVAANPDASTSISFQVALYNVPAAPVEFTGDLLLSSSYTSSSVLISVPTNGTYNLVMTALAGNILVTLDGNSLGVVTSTNSTSVELTSDTHEIDITADPLGQSPDYDQWDIQIQPSTGLSTPTLSVNILPSCSTNSTLNETVCTLTAQVTASDGKNVSANYQWSSDAGSFNSTSGQAVLWTVPSKNQNQTYQVICNANAQGYTGASASVPISITPVPEFVSGVNILLLVPIMAAALMIRRSLLKWRIWKRGV